MDPLRLIEAQFGFFTRQEALAAGHGHREITRMVRQRVWVRIRRGFYVYADTWATTDPEGRHRIRLRAVLRSLGPTVAASHQSGVLLHGIDSWGLHLDRVHVTRLDGGAGRVEGDVVHHEGFCTDDDVMEVDGLQVLRPERCVLEAASRVNDEVALCLLDSGLRARCFQAEALHERYRLLEHWPFMHHLARIVPLADGRSGSVGESRGRHLFRVAGIPAPALQFEVRRPDGSIAGITDWAWPELEQLGEFDGELKYGRLRRLGQQPGDVVFEEKRREDELRELTGYRFLRLIWADFDAKAATIARLQQLLRRTG